MEVRSSLMSVEFNMASAETRDNIVSDVTTVVVVANTTVYGGLYLSLLIIVIH